MIDRAEAVKLLQKYLNEDKLRKHSFAVEAIMQETAARLHKDRSLWSLVGLLHDLDYEYTQGNPQRHGNVTVDIIDQLLPESALHAIKAHNYIHTDVMPISSLDKALIAADAISGLIIATALIMPQQKLAHVTVSSIRKKFKDNSFAKGCDRKKILLCEDIGFSLDDFLTLGLQSLQPIASSLDL